MDQPGAAACNPRAPRRSADPKRQTTWSCRDVYSHELRPPHTRDPVAASAAYAQGPGTDFPHLLTAPGRCREGSTGAQLLNEQAQPIAWSPARIARHNTLPAKEARARA